MFVCSSHWRMEGDLVSRAALGTVQLETVGCTDGVQEHDHSVPSLVLPSLEPGSIVHPGVAAFTSSVLVP